MNDRDDILEKLASALPPDITLLPSKPMMEVYNLAAIYAQDSRSVIISGETGVGKEGIVKAIHNLSARKAKPLTVINCTSFQANEELAEVEIFGNVKGAYTGADSAKAGYILEAVGEPLVLDSAKKWFKPLANTAGGTLFLDEIHHLPLSTRTKLLRFLEERTIRPFGGGAEHERTVDVRIIVATNEEDVASALQPTDFYQRLAERHIHIPPLRERPEDIAELLKNYIRHSGKIQGFAAEALAYLKNRRWPGNIRDLIRVVDLAVTILPDTGTGPRELDHASLTIASHLLDKGKRPPEPTPLQTLDMQLLYGEISPKDLWLMLNKHVSGIEFNSLSKTEQLTAIQSGASQLLKNVGGDEAEDLGLAAPMPPIRERAAPLQLPDDLWDELTQKFHLDKHVNGSQVSGRPSVSPQNILGAYYYMRLYGCSWTDLKSLSASEYPSESTYTRFFERIFGVQPLVNNATAAERNAQKKKLEIKRPKIMELREKIEKHIADYVDYKDMVPIPAGEFMMGSTDKDIPAAEDDAQPQHIVSVDAFSMDTCVVTNEDYLQFLIANPEWDMSGEKSKIFCDEDYLRHWKGKNYPEGKAKHPVIYVSWFAAMAYARWLGKRLPTEAEWEKAARGGLENEKYPWGDAITKHRANYRAKGAEIGLLAAYSHPPNAYGLYNMVGNVWEWCLDDYDPDFYGKEAAAKNPLAMNQQQSREWLLDHFTSLEPESSAVTRGAGFVDWYHTLRCALRNGNTRELCNMSLGFRCVRDGTRSQ